MLNDSKPDYIRNLERHLPNKSIVNDFYAIDLAGSAIKDDTASMEAPIYSLSKVKDIKTWVWTSTDGKKSLKVIPSSEYGRATIFDKDILIYAISCLVDRKNSGFVPTKTVRFTAYTYLKATNKSVSKGAYDRLGDSLKRLVGTSIETNIKTGKKEAVALFHILEKAQFVIVEDRLQSVEITLSDWLYNAINGLDVLTLNRSYFELQKPLERRLYEIARKHCASKAFWLIGFDNLLKKAGSRASHKEFKRMLKQVIKSDLLPDFRYSLSADGSMVKIYQKDQLKMAAAIGCQ
jgi:plasmid replication initiation protein